MYIQFPKQIETCLKELNQKYEAVLTGGFVRDALLRRPSKDYDIATSATPEQVKEVFKRYTTFDSGIKHGTVTVVIDLHPIEITTYRIESGYTDSRHPDTIEFTTDLKKDCMRRDFTINAICLNDKHDILDYFDGQKDLEDKIIRCVGNPKERFYEDALRIMRAIRFSATLGFEIEPATKAALFEERQNLRKISMERFIQEFQKIVVCDDFDVFLNEYLDVFSVMIPELKQLSEIPDVWNKIITDLHDAPKVLTYRLALIFLHLSRFNADKIIPMHSASTFIMLAKRLRMNNEITGTVARFIQNSQIELVPDKVLVKKRLNQFGDSFFDYLGFRKTYDLSEEVYDKISKQVSDIIGRQECFSLKQLAINGSDLKQLGLTGTKISSTLNQCLLWVIEGQVDNNKYKILDKLNETLKGRN